MQILESHLEDYLFHEMLDPKNLYAKTGLRIGNYIKHFRQVNLGPYGIADLVTIDIGSIPFYATGYRRIIHVTVIELKSGGIDESVYLQALRYASGVRHFLNSFMDTKCSKVEVSVCLIGGYVSLKPNKAIPLFGFVENVFIGTYSVIGQRIEISMNENHRLSEDDFIWSRRWGNQQFFNLFQKNIKGILKYYQVRLSNYIKMYKEMEARNGK